MTHPSVAIVLVNWNGFSYTRNCIESLKKTSYQNVSQGRIIGAFGTGIPLSILLMGIVFDLLILPGAEAMMHVGLIWLGLVLVLIIIEVLKSGVNQYHRRVLTPQG